MRTRISLLTACAAIAMFGCEGVIHPLGFDPNTGGGSGAGNGGSGGSGSGNGGGDGWSAPDTSCDVTQYPNATLEGALQLFTAEVYPAMAAGNSQCASCHGTTSMRRFIITDSPSDTFYLSRQAALFNDDPVSLVSRVSNPDARVRMPVGLDPLPDSVITALGKTACMVRAYEVEGGVAADEQFPPNLLQPYAGADRTSYDNPFINYVQLQNKVKAVFADTWVRANVDQFDKNIGLFGGVNFTTHFVESRIATAEFLLGLDTLAPDVCGQAATNKTGPFAGLTLTSSTVDQPAQTDTVIQGESMERSPASGAGNLSPSTNPTSYFCYTNCSLSDDYAINSGGTYRVSVKGKTSGAGTTCQVKVTIGGVASTTLLSFDSDTAFQEKSVDIVVPGPVAMGSVMVQFVNDGSDNGVDRNLYFDQVKVTGPLGAGTGTTRADAAKSNINTLYKKMLFRDASAAEKTSALALVRDLGGLGTMTSAWTGLCEALVRHPDFLFTMPPSVEDTTDATVKQQLRLVALTQRTLGRPPTSAEFTALSSSSFESMVDQVFASADFQKYYFNRIQLRIESAGTPQSDEPARIWTYVTLNGRPYQEVLTADYTVDESFVKQSRPAEHGHSGVLTAKGYLNNKQGLPHYNYPARVLSGFMGMVFEVPPEVFDQRAAATAASTVDPSSVCFSCHQLLTPLAHQRLRWDDNGDYRTTDSSGAILDDTDRDLVASYPFKGEGLEAFAEKATKKEKFVRRMINTQVRLLLGRELRADDDERVLYKQLWDLTEANAGDMRVVLKAVAKSQTFRGEP